MDNEEILDKIIMVMNDRVDKYNETHTYKLSIAYGYAVHIKADAESVPLNRLFKEADDAMYQDKLNKHAARE